MKLRSIAYAAVVAIAATAFTLASATTSEAKKHTKKKAAAAPASSAWCWPGGAPVCATKGGLKFTYANSCYAAMDKAKVVSNKACPAPKAKKAKKAGKKVAKKAKAKKKM